MDANTMSFTEGTVGMIEDKKVMFSNIMLQDYILDNGETKEGPAASLSLPTSKEWLTVGKGSNFELDGKIYVIVDVIEDDPFGEVLIKVAE